MRNVSPLRPLSTLVMVLSSGRIPGCFPVVSAIRAGTGSLNVQLLLKFTDNSWLEGYGWQRDSGSGI